MGTLKADVTLPFLQVEGRLRSKARIYNVTGAVRPTGVTIFCFIGPQNRSVEWEVIAGGGAITAFTDYTDSYGRASARYEAGGWVGPVTVSVKYAS